jgi:hypothetical protein
VLADVDHVKIERVEPAGLDRAAESVLVQQGRARSNDDARQVELLDVLLDQFLARVGTHVLVVPREDHAGELLDVFRDRRTVHHAGNVMAAVADIEADANIFVHLNHVDNSALKA